MDYAYAVRFANEWVAAWNAHDVDRIVEHYADDVVFRSPVAEALVGAVDGEVRGKAALRAYWAAGLGRSPDLHFEIQSVQSGTDSVVINYRNQRGQLVSEVLTFRDGVVVAGLAAYGPPSHATPK